MKKKWTICRWHHYDEHSSAAGVACWRTFTFFLRQSFCHHQYHKHEGIIVFTLFSFFCTCYRWRGRRSFKAILIMISIHVFIDNWSLIYSLFAFTAVAASVPGRQFKYMKDIEMPIKFLAWIFKNTAQHEMPFASFTHTHNLCSRICKLNECKLRWGNAKLYLAIEKVSTPLLLLLMLREQKEMQT